MREFSVPTEDIIRWRRHIHQHPELSFQEHQTAEYIVSQLSGLDGLEITRPTETGVVAILKGTKAAGGKCVALRADIDALPVQEQSTCEFASVVPNVAHVCGHDNHAAMLMGAAKTLSQMRDQFAGTVKFVFQPAEEILPEGGALALIRAGVFDDVDACFGLHVINDPAGVVRVLESEAATTSVDSCEIHITGKGSHGSMPHMGIDPLMTGAQMVMALHTIVARNVDPDDFAVVSPTVFHCGQTPNVIANEATLCVNTRARRESTRVFLRKRIDEIVEQVARTTGATATVKWLVGYSAIVQDRDLVARVKRVAFEQMGPEGVIVGKSIPASEDFSEYSKVCPCAYFTIGAGNAEQGYPYANHHPKFAVDEKCLPVGARMEVALVLDMLGA